MKGYPSWFTARFVHATMLALWASGCLLLPTTLVSRLDWEVAWRLDSDARLLVTALHVLFGFLVFALLGALWSIHMRHWWRKKLGRVSGAGLAALLVILGLSGIGILYLGNEELLTATSVIHGVVGLLLVAPYLWHTIIRLLSH